MNIHRGRHKLVDGSILTNNGVVIEGRVLALVSHHCGWFWRRSPHSSLGKDPSVYAGRCARTPGV